MQWKAGAKAGLTLSFDDGYKQTYELTRELLSAYRIRATYFVPADYVGKTYNSFPIMSWKDIKECIDMGMEIGSHSITHREYATSIANRAWRLLRDFRAENPKVDYAKYIIDHRVHRLHRGSTGFKYSDHDLELETVLSKQIIEQELSPYRVSSFAYPMGSFDDNYKRLVMKSGYSSARSTLIGLNEAAGIDPYALKCCVWRCYTTPSMMNRWVDRALKSGSWMIELYHHVTDASDSVRDSCSLEHLRAHLEYATSKRIWIDTQDNVTSHITHATSFEDNGG
jgi:peptidoglycan/xylan/chitin deacetylase (PgdA/CDA1 family)